MTKKKNDELTKLKVAFPSLSIMSFGAERAVRALILRKEKEALSFRLSKALIDPYYIFKDVWKAYQKSKKEHL